VHGCQHISPHSKWKMLLWQTTANWNTSVYNYDVINIILKLFHFRKTLFLFSIIIWCMVVTISTLFSNEKCYFDNCKLKYTVYNLINGISKLFHFKKKLFLFLVIILCMIVNVSTHFLNEKYYDNCKLKGTTLQLWFD